MSKVYTTLNAIKNNSVLSEWSLNKLLQYLNKTETDDE